MNLSHLALKSNFRYKCTNLSGVKILTLFWFTTQNSQGLATALSSWEAAPVRPLWGNRLPEEVQSCDHSRCSEVARRRRQSLPSFPLSLRENKPQPWDAVTRLRTGRLLPTGTPKGKPEVGIQRKGGLFRLCMLLMLTLLHIPCQALSAQPKAPDLQQG